MNNKGFVIIGEEEGEGMKQRKKMTKKIRRRQEYKSSDRQTDRQAEVQRDRPNEQFCSIVSVFNLRMIATKKNQ